MRRQLLVTLLLLLTVIGVALAQQSGPIGTLIGKTDSSGGLVTSGSSPTDSAHLAAIETAVEALQADVAAGSTQEWLLPPDLAAFKAALTQPVPVGADRVFRDGEHNEAGTLIPAGEEMAYMLAVRAALVGA